MAPAQASLLAKLDTQERVRDFLTNAVASGRASHAYLFLGAPGAGKLDAAWALAQAFLCEQDGCGACDSCVRVARHTHPDVHYYTPESATGYLIAQTRELLDDVPLAPIRAKAKVYIIDRAEQLRANTANALLKTLEEPPEGVMFILLGTSADVILPTIVSRCQCVPFRLVSPTVAAQAVSRATGQDLTRCRMAVAVAGSPTRGIEFLKSAERQDARRRRAGRGPRHRSGPCALPHGRRSSGKPRAWHRVPQERRAPGRSPSDGSRHRFAHRRRRGRRAQPRQVAHRRR